MPRPVLDSGTATQTVYVTQAKEGTSLQEMERQIEIHRYRMRQALEAKGFCVRRIVRLFDNFEVKLLAFWEKLGEKPGRRSQKGNAKRRAAAALRFKPKGRPDVSGSDSTPEAGTRL